MKINTHLPVKYYFVLPILKSEIADSQIPVEVWTRKKNKQKEIILQFLKSQHFIWQFKTSSKWILFYVPT